MSKLKLKEKYKGLSVTRSDIRVGKITFNANEVKEEHYQNYYDLGFTELFEVVEEPTSVKNTQVEPKKELPYEDKMVKPKEEPAPKKKPVRRRKKKTDEE